MFADRLINFKGGLYSDLADYLLKICTISVSTASVERVFSSLTMIKTKVRNRLLVDSIDNILTIRTGLRMRDENSESFTVPEDMLTQKEIASNLSDEQLETMFDTTFSQSD